MLRTLIRWEITGKRKPADGTPAGFLYVSGFRDLLL